ncbi:MAG: sigma-70 family RNA polymerase sigma factor [Gemmataceae bacterium]
MTRDKDKRARFLEHLEPLQGALEGYCRRALFDASDMADVLQCTLMKSFRDFDLYAEGTNFRSWVFHYLHLEIQNWNRKRARTRGEHLPEELSTEETWEMIRDEALLDALLENPDVVLERCGEEVSEGVRALPEQARAIFLLHAIAGFAYREIAEILAIPIGTVMSSLARSRLRLRKHLAALAEERGWIQRESCNRDKPTGEVKP